jgi:hypothetical protein
MVRNKAGVARLNSTALHAALERRRNGMPLRAFCAEIGGVTPSTLLRMKDGSNPSADALVRFLLYLGTTDLDRFIDRGDRHG